MAGHRNYGLVKRGMCTGPVCVMGWFALGGDIKTTGPDVRWEWSIDSDHGTRLFHTYKRRNEFVYLKVYVLLP